MQKHIFYCTHNFIQNLIFALIIFYGSIFFYFCFCFVWYIGVKWKLKRKLSCYCRILLVVIAALNCGRNTNMEYEERTI